uniref:Uncharacterized protein n=1 Tax=viral metagenome TaxID=1070528 RepID=A0A6C0J649_9ZZZZ
MSSSSTPGFQLTPLRIKLKCSRCENRYEKSIFEKKQVHCTAAQNRLCRFCQGGDKLRSIEKNRNRKREIIRKQKMEQENSLEKVRIKIQSLESTIVHFQQQILAFEQRIVELKKLAKM